MSIMFSVQEFLKAHVRIIGKRNELRAIQLRSGLSQANIVVVMVVRNERDRLDFFLEYYRRISVEHFIIIDNNSDDDTRNFLCEQCDISVFSTSGSYAEARFGNDWVNLILNRYCVGKWILYVDADEIIVYPHVDTQSISRLTDHLDRRGDRTLRCLMVDMYSDVSVHKSYVRPGQNPLDVCQFFDSYGYHQRYESYCRTEWTKGGVRGRIFFSDNIWSGPALNKTPLVKWRFGYSFLKSSHQIWPLRLNSGRAAGDGHVSGALLHYKFTSSMPLKIKEEASRSQHTAEYRKYAEVQTSDDVVLIGTPSQRYKNWATLIEVGLMHGANWTEQ